MKKENHGKKRNLYVEKVWKCGGSVKILRKYDLVLRCVCVRMFILQAAWPLGDKEL